MRNLALHTLTERISADGHVTPDEALDLRRAVFPDGVVSREEAEALIALEAKVANTDAEWTYAFVEALSDHMLQAAAQPSHLTDADVAWLEARFGQDGARETELAVLLKLMERADSAPERLSQFTRARLTRLLAGAPIGANETELIRRCIYAAAGSGATFVTEEETCWLFALDASHAATANHPSWGDLFVKAIMNHLLARRAPALLERNGQLGRRAWVSSLLTPQPASFLARSFEGGLDGFRAHLGMKSDLDRLEAHYEAANAAAAEDEKLTLAEIAWAVGMTRADGKRTPNEDKLLAEIKKIEGGAVTPPAS